MCARPKKDLPDLLKRPCARPAAKLDIGQALKLKAQGLSQAQIAKLAGVSPQAVSTALKHFVAIPQVAAVRAEAVQHLPELLDQKMLEMIASIDEERLQKADLRSLATSYGILYDKKRLHEGQSTSNVAILASAVMDSWDDITIDNSV